MCVRQERKRKKNIPKQNFFLQALMTECECVYVCVYERVYVVSGATAITKIKIIPCIKFSQRIYT